MKLTDKTTALSGVAAKRGELYAKMGIATVGDLLDHLPREYIDFSEPVNIADAPLNEQAVVSGTVTAKIPAARNIESNSCCF